MVEGSRFESGESVKPERVSRVRKEINVKNKGELSEWLKESRFESGESVYTGKRI